MNSYIVDTLRSHRIG